MLKKVCLWFRDEKKIRSICFQDLAYGHPLAASLFYFSSIVLEDVGAGWCDVIKELHYTGNDKAFCKEAFYAIDVNCH